MTGDILSVAIGADGWYADITIEGLSTGGTYSLGLGTNNDPATGTPKITFTVVSLGYDDTGAATTITRTIYGTKQVRKAYPNDATNEESASGGNVTVRVALSDYIFAKDATGAGNSGTAPTVTILSGFYTQSATPNNAATNLAVTNNSTATYQKVIGNWSWPGYEKMTSASKLRAVAFHRSGQSGRPVRAVKFTLTDGTTTNTETVTAPTYDSTVGDASPVVEYVTTSDLTSGLTQGAVLTGNFVAYPWTGDSDSVLDTSTGTAQPTPLHGPLKAVCDRTGAYCTSVAVVDSVSGSDGTGAVTNNFNQASPPAAFATIDGAADALRTFNSTTYSRANKAGSIIYLKAGNYAWIGGTTTADGVVPDAWCTVAAFPGVAASAVNINSQSGSRTIGVKTKIQGVTITAQSASGTITGMTHLWVDQCIINCPTSSQPPFYINTVWYVTRSTITSLNQGLRPYSTVNAAPAIIRGNTMSGYSGQVFVYTVLGNNKTDNSTSAIQHITSYTSSTVPVPDRPIIAYNKYLGANCTTAPVGFPVVLNTSGAAFVQNVIENYKNTTGALIQIAADTSTVAGSDPTDNVIIWNNTFAGQRQNFAYNDNGSEAPRRRYWSVKNNITYDYNIKTDNTVAVGANAARVANWSQLYGVGWSGNLLLDTGNGFNNEFDGLKTLRHDWLGSNQGAYVQFTSYAGAIVGTSDGAGQGTYTLQSTSPAVGMQRDLLLPFDIAGSSRASTSAAGAYHYGSTLFRNRTGSRRLSLTT